uniref:Ig-like domain-containing protein n=1 Tax=Poecilia mexicana TaxID=48701 RepID=A0A3B3WYN1_9TELE
MQTWPPFSLLYKGLSSEMSLEDLTQPASLTVQPGQPLTISCQVSYSVSSYWTYWIRQPAGKGLDWIGDAKGSSTDYKDSLRNKFSISTDSSSNTVTLKGQNLQPEDAAVYYCARLHSEAKHEQTCTKTHSVPEHLKYCKPPEEAPSDHKLFGKTCSKRPRPKNQSSSSCAVPALPLSHAVPLF